MMILMQFLLMFSLIVMKEDTIHLSLFCILEYGTLRFLMLAHKFILQYFINLNIEAEIALESSCTRKDLKQIRWRILYQITSENIVIV